MTEAVTAGRAGRWGSAAAITGTQRNILSWGVASLAMLALLLAPAVWNGFPFIFPDTGGYLARPIEGSLVMGRSALYGVFLYAGIPLAFWPNAILQAVMTVWLIVLTMRAVGLGGRPWLALGIVAMLCAVTSLPWFAGQLMPDILFPAAVLALYLLAFRAEQLATWEQGGLAAVIAFAIGSHMAAAGMCVGIVAALWLLTRATRLALPKPRLLLAAGTVAAGVALCPISNFAITGSFAFTPGGSTFLFGRLIEDGIVARYLDEHCPDATLRLCAHKGELPEEADDWLWGTDTLLYKFGGPEAYADEAVKIILATLARYPLDHAVTAAGAVFNQLVAFRTEISTADNEPTIETLTEHTPQLAPQFMTTRQQTLSVNVDPLNTLHVPLAALSIAALGAALIWRRRLAIAPELSALCLTVLLALAANATICGIFSHPVDRYQSRLVLLAPFVVALLAAARWRPAVDRELTALGRAPN